MNSKASIHPQASSPNRIYTKDQLVTLADLDQLRNELLREMKFLIGQQQNSVNRRWLKSIEVRRMLGISSGTLQHLRDTGQIPFTRLGGLIYYEEEAIQKLLEKR